VHELIAKAKLILCWLTHYAGLVTMVILHHVLQMLSWSNESLYWNVLALCKRYQINSLLSIARSLLRLFFKVGYSS
jgi:hypothetical protein